jgi:hypothetical protein
LILDFVPDLEVEKNIQNDNNAAENNHHHKDDKKNCVDIKWDKNNSFQLV